MPALLVSGVRLRAPLRTCADIAQDITRRFLLHLLADISESGVQQARPQFRRYLLEKLNAFLAGDWRAMSEKEPMAEFAEPPPDLEQRNRDDNAGALSPEQAYQRSFALEILARAFRRLREEASQTGHLPMYEALEPYLSQRSGARRIRGDRRPHAAAVRSRWWSRSSACASASANWPARNSPIP